MWISANDTQIITDDTTQADNVSGSSRDSSRESAFIEIEVLPGPSAFLTALIGSGLPTDKFLFLGFLPKKGLENYLSKFENLEATIIFYESPQRIPKTLDVIEKVFGNVDIVIAREISKIYEEYIRGKLSEIKEKLKNKKLKGELTVIFRK